MSVDELISMATEAIKNGQLPEARRLLKRAIDDGGDRPEIIHSLAGVELQLGEPEVAAGLAEEALRRTSTSTEPGLADLRARFALTLAAAQEDMDAPDRALATYRQALSWRPSFGDALQGLGYLLLSLGELDAGAHKLAQFVESDAPELLRDGTTRFLDALSRWRATGNPARKFLDAHRRLYAAFFDAMARKQEALGWIAETAKMKRAPDGTLVHVVPEGARPYATVRVDLVDPSTGQAGMIGDQPMIVPLKGYEPLAQTPVLFPWEGFPFPVFVSSQTPWDQLPLHILLEHGDPLDVVDPVIADWYKAGFDGAFGTSTSGRFHYVSDPERVRPHGVLYHLDLGRAEARCLDDLLQRLVALHEVHRIRRVVFGRGHLPA